LQISQKSSTFAIVIELERHIEILLLSNDCVIVPDLGGFMTHHVEARYDDECQMFLPPLRTLGFNPQLKLNDSLLAQSYIEAYDISYPEAIRRIESEVHELKQHLENEGSYELNNLGLLSINDEGKMEFEPCEAGILTPSLYGLSSFEALPLNAAKKAVAKPSNPTEDSANEAPAEAPSMVVAMTPDENTDDYDEQNDDNGKRGIIIKMSWIRNAVAVAAAILFYFIFTTPVSNDDQQSVNKSQVLLPVIVRDTNIKSPEEPTPQMVQEVLEKQTTEDSTATAVVVDTTTVADGAETGKTQVTTGKTEAQPNEVGTEEEIPASKVNTEKKAPSRNYYCVVLASQVTESNANEFVVKLKKQGLDDARVYLYNNMRRVICGKFNSSDEAHQAVYKIHQMPGLAEAWVYQVKE